MTNVSFADIADYRDIESLNLYQERIGEGMSHEAMMRGIHANGRDNARTPMQWDSTPHGGFTTGQPWIDINPNFRTVNVAAALDDPDSVFYHYQKLVALRKQLPLLVHGDFRQIVVDHPQVFAWRRTLGEQTLVVINNFTRDAVMLAIPDNLQSQQGHCLINNYAPREQLEPIMELQPYESFALLIERL